MDNNFNNEMNNNRTQGTNSSANDSIFSDRYSSYGGNTANVPTGSQNYSGYSVSYNNRAYKSSDEAKKEESDFYNPYSYNANTEENVLSQSTSYSSLYDYSQAPQTNTNSGYTVSDFGGGKNKKKKKGSRIALGFVAIFCALIVAGGGFYVGTQYRLTKVDGEQAQTTASNSVANATTVKSSDDSGEFNSSITEVVENAMPSMVSINTIVKQSMNDPYSYFYGYLYGDDYNSGYETNASGSGIIIGQNEQELLVATNYHVVEDSSEIAVEFIDGESYSATVKGTASDNDLAVISVPIEDISADTLSKIKVAVIGDSTQLKLGEPAIAIGNSLGYGQSVTVGYISATDREVQITDKTMNLIQTDAAINPGNSGGALLNIKGEVIGINSAKYSDTSVEGTGYAIPISDAAPIINDLMNSTYNGESETPYLGIYGQDVPTAYQDRLGWPAGVYVSQVEDSSPAQLAGLQQGDIITAINGTNISSMEELQNVLAECKVGDTAELTVSRYENDKMKEGTLKATLIARSDVEEKYDR